MVIHRSYKTELSPNKAQITALSQHCGAARFVYNWGLSQKIEQRNSGDKILKATKLDKELRSVIDEKYPWLRKIGSHTRQAALADVDKAFNNYFERLRNGKSGKGAGFPSFKKRKQNKGSYRCYLVTVETDAIRLPRIGRVRLKESNYLPCGCYGKEQDAKRIISATITESAGRWFVSIQVDEQLEEVRKSNKPVVGVDLGIKTLATCSDGHSFHSQCSLKMQQRKLRRLQRSLSRKSKGSANFKKSSKRLGKFYKHIANARNHNLHHISSYLTKTKSVVVIEDLNVKGMRRNHHLAQALDNCAFNELRRQLTYKGKWYGCDVQVVSRWFPSSKTCSSCGVVKEDLKLSDRQFKCADCGFICDRDLNAAHNLKNVAVSHTDTQNACGGESSGESAMSRETFSYEAGSEQSVVSMSVSHPLSTRVVAARIV